MAMDEAYEARMRSFDRGCNEARALFDSDDLDGAVAQAEDLLDNNDLPRYHRIKLLMILVASLVDWWEAKELLHDANILWQMARNCFPIGESAGADASLAELRPALDSLIEEHEAGRSTWLERMGIGPAQLDGAADEEELTEDELEGGSTGTASPSEVQSGVEEEPEDASKDGITASKAASEPRQSSPSRGASKGKAKDWWQHWRRTNFVQYRRKISSFMAWFSS